MIIIKEDDYYKSFINHLDEESLKKVVSENNKKRKNWNERKTENLLL